MRNNRLSKTTNNVKKDGRQDSEVNRVRKELSLGEVIWVKTNPSSWWLGQVVDENTVSVKRKPKRKLVGEVLVRLYGSYTYLYADPEKYSNELIEILKQNNGSSKEMFQKSLEQEVAYTKSSALKRKISEHKENAKDGAPEDKKLKQNGVDKNLEVGGLSSGSIGKLPKVRFQVLRTRKDKGFPENLEGAVGAKTQVNSAVRSSGRTRIETSKVEISKQDEVKKGHKADNQGSEIASMKSCALKRKVSERKVEKARDGAPKAKMSKQSGVDKNQEQQDNIGKLPEVSTRVLRTRKANGFPQNLEGLSRAQTQANRGDVSSGRTRKETSKADILKQDGVKKERKADSQGSGADPLGNSPDLSLRRVKVMQSIGLVAPSGSPYKNESHISSTP